jgi:hypothetical protein
VIGSIGGWLEGFTIGSIVGGVVVGSIVNWLEGLAVGSIVGCLEGWTSGMAVISGSWA